MCGINGYFSKNNDFKIDLEDLNKCLIHRGPDNQGVYYDEDLNVGFGHTRLSIIDLDNRSNQPLIIDNIIISFNGEIYNYKYLKKQYLSDVLFQTDSDTEVVIHLYKKLGIEKTLDVMNGMFAFSLLDKDQALLYLCKDKVGKKPLYYLLDDDKIIFASEAKCFKGIFNLNINDDVFNDTMSNRFSDVLSPFSNINFLNNGTYLSCDLNSFSIEHKVYFKFEDLIDSSMYDRLNNLAYNDIIDELEGLLRESIDIRLLSDVEVGTVNSGGLDSSLVSAMVFEKAKLKIFHVDVIGMSETKYAKVLSDSLNINMEIVQLNHENFSYEIDKIINHYEYPLVHPNSYGIYLLSKLSKSKNVKVLLSGDGADEIFGGYDFYLSSFKEQKLPYIFKKLYHFSKLITNNNYRKKIKTTAFKNSIIRREKIKNKLSHINLGQEREMQSFLISSLYEYLQPLNLRADKLGMANSVEFRAPFLDINVMKFAINLPLKFKMNAKEGKIILKKLAERKLPKSLIYRKKVGFPVPLINQATIDINNSVQENYVTYSKQILSKK